VAEFAATDQSENSDKGVEKMSGFIDPDRRNSVQCRSEGIEYRSIVVEITPMKSIMVNKKR